MSLKELVDINQSNFDCYDFGFSLSRQFHVGKIIRNSLKSFLKEYVIFLEFKIDYETEYDLYEHLFKLETFNTGDKGIPLDRIIIRRFYYQPNKPYNY